MLIVISGLPGTGKSAVAAEVARELDGVRLSIDPIEDALLGSGFPPSWRTGVAAYEVARAAAEQNLVLGRTVIVDAVNDSELARDTWRSAATRSGVALFFVLLTLDDAAEHRRRLEGRGHRHAHVPEPTWEDVRQRAASYEPWVGDCVRVDASVPVGEVARAILDHLPSS